MNRRDIFKGAAGAAAAATLINPSQARPPNYPPSLPKVDMYRDANGPSQSHDIPDLLFEAKRVWVAQAESEAQRLREGIDREMAALDRLKSVSDAYKAFRRHRLWKEQQSIANRLRELMRGIGW